MKRRLPYLVKRKLMRMALVVAPSTVAVTFAGVYGSSNTFLHNRLYQTKQLLNESFDENRRLINDQNAASNKKSYEVSLFDMVKKSRNNAKSSFDKRHKEIRNDLDYFETKNHDLLWDSIELSRENDEQHRKRRQEQDRCLPMLRHGRRNDPNCRTTLYRLFRIDTSKK